MNNATSLFLQSTSQLAQKVTLQLDDVQALYGGQRLLLAGDGRLVVTRVAPGGGQTVTEYIVPAADVAAIGQLCLAQDLLTIRPAERPGIPDEVRQTLTLTNGRGELHKVSKWAGVPDSRFAAILAGLLQLAARAENEQPAG